MMQAQNPFNLKVDADGNVTLRVVDYFYDADGTPIVDEATRQHKRVVSSYRRAGQQYRPGETVTMPLAEATEELRTLGPSRDAAGRPGRPGLLEPLEHYERREAERKEREAKRHQAEQADNIAVTRQQLQEAVAQRQQLQRKIDEVAKQRQQDHEAARQREEAAR